MSAQPRQNATPCARFGRNTVAKGQRWRLPTEYQILTAKQPPTSGAHLEMYGTLRNLWDFKAQPYRARFDREDNLRCARVLLGSARILRCADAAIAAAGQSDRPSLVICMVLLTRKHIFAFHDCLLTIIAWGVFCLAWRRPFPVS